MPLTTAVVAASMAAPRVCGCSAGASELLDAASVELLPPPAAAAALLARGSERERWAVARPRRMPDRRCGTSTPSCLASDWKASGSSVAVAVAVESSSSALVIESRDVSSSVEVLSLWFCFMRSSLMLGCSMLFRRSEVASATMLVTRPALVSRGRMPHTFSLSKNSPSSLTSSRRSSWICTSGRFLNGITCKTTEWSGAIGPG